MAEATMTMFLWIFSFFYVIVPLFATGNSNEDRSTTAEDVAGVHGSLNNLTGQCSKDLRLVLLDSSKLSAYLDSTGKPSSGLLSGNHAWLGNYDQCQTLSHSLYCLLHLKASAHIETNGTRRVGLQWGLCGVSSCNQSQIEQYAPQIFQEVFQLPWLHIDNSTTANCAEPVVQSAGYWATVWITVTLGALCLLGTLFHLWVIYKENNATVVVHCIDDRGPRLASQAGGDHCSDLQPVLQQEVWERTPDAQRLKKALKNERGIITHTALCFSVVHNLGQLLQTEEKKIKGRISSLDGVRVVSIWWIVLAHCFLGTYSSGAVENPESIVTYSRSFTWQPIANAYFAVDTFFFLSGFLVAYLSLPYFGKNPGKFPFAKYYLHRYIRLTPLIGFSILVWTFVLPRLGYGPLWYNMASQPTCEKYWWTNLLYILNIYPINPADQCIGWTWYLANDMQLYIIAPFILWCLHCNARRGLALVILMLIGSFTATATLIAVYNIDVNLTGMVLNQNTKGAHDYEQIIYSKPYCRIAPYLVGIVLGFILDKERDQVKKLSKVLNVGLWLLSITVGLVLVHSFYGTFHGHPLNKAENLIYGTFSHFVWSLCLAWVVYSCRHGYGGVIDMLLSWPGWAPLSRMTYAVYMTHPLVIYYYISCIQTTIHVSNLHMALLFGGAMLVSYAGAALVMLLIELPFTNVEKLIRGQKS